MKQETLLKKVQFITEKRWFRTVALFAVLLLLATYFAMGSKGRFVSPINLKIIIDQALVVAAVATGGVYIFSTGNVNIAMGATTVLTATLAVIVYNLSGSIVLMVLFSLTFAVLIMMISAFLSTFFKVSVVFVTIVMSVMLNAL